MWLTSIHAQFGRSSVVQLPVHPFRELRFGHTNMRLFARTILATYVKTLLPAWRWSKSWITGARWCWARAGLSPRSEALLPVHPHFIDALLLPYLRNVMINSTIVYIYSLYAIISLYTSKHVQASIDVLLSILVKWRQLVMLQRYCK